MKSSYEYDDVSERITDATATKEKGSGYFKAGKYSLALKVYQRALKIVDKDSVHKDEEKESTRPIRILLRLNIAACLLKLNEGTEALHECDLVRAADRFVPVFFSFHLAPLNINAVVRHIFFTASVVRMLSC